MFGYLNDIKKEYWENKGIKKQAIKQSHCHSKLSCSRIKHNDSVRATPPDTFAGTLSTHLPLRPPLCWSARLHGHIDNLQHYKGREAKILH